MNIILYYYYLTKSFQCYVVKSRVLLVRWNNWDLFDIPSAPSAYAEAQNMFKRIIQFLNLSTTYYGWLSATLLDELWRLLSPVSEIIKCHVLKIITALKSINLLEAFHKVKCIDTKQIFNFRVNNLFQNAQTKFKIRFTHCNGKTAEDNCLEVVNVLSKFVSVTEHPSHTGK